MIEPAIIAAPPGRALDQALIGFLSSAKRSDPTSPLAVVVPTNLCRRGLVSLAARSLKGLFNVRFLTLLDLARLMAEDRLLDRGLAPVPPAGPRFALSRILASRGRGPFSGSPPSGGVESALLAAFSDIDEGCAGGGLSPGARQDRPGERAAETGLLHGLYRRSLEEAGFYDTAALFSCAAACTSAPARLRGAAAVVFHGFYDLTPLQRRVVAAAARFAPPVFLVPETPDGWSDFGRPTLEWISRTFRIEPARPAVPKAARGIMDAPAGGKLALEIVSAAGAKSQIREVLRTALAEARDGSVGVLFRSAGPDLREAGAEAERLSIPVFVQGGLAAASSGPARALRTFFDALRLDFRRDAAMRLLEAVSAGPGSAAPDGPEPVPEWDRLSAEAGVTSGEEAWMRAAAAAGPAGERLRTVLEAVFEAARDWKGCRSWREFVQAARGVASMARSVGQAGDAAFEALTESLSGLAALDSFRFAPTAPEAEAAVLEACASASRPAGAPLRERITIADAMSARGLGFDTVVLPGMTDGVFPRAIGQDPVLPDEEREAANRAMSRAGQDGRLEPSSRGHAEERFLFSAALSQASRKAVLVYPGSDEASGRPNLPSFFILDALSDVLGRRADFADLARHPGFRKVGVRHPYPADLSECVSVAEHDLAYFLRLPRRGRTAELGRIGDAYRHASLAGLMLEGRYGPRIGRFDGRIEGGALEILRRIHPGAGPFSASDLETYAACPFSYFLSRVLGAEASDPPEDVEDPGPAAFGESVHDSLREVFASILEAGTGRISPGSALESAIAAAGAVMARADARVGPRPGIPALSRAAARKAVRVVESALRHEAERGEDGYSPVLFEHVFGRQGRGSGPAEYRGSDGAVYAFKGRIDRADYNPAAREWRIVDYKTGKAGRYRNDRFGGGESVQLPVYLTAVPGFRPPGAAAGAIYEFLSEDGCEEKSFSPAVLSERACDFEKILRTITSGIASGLFFARPGRCDSCGYARVCGPDAKGIWARKEPDAALAAFLEMKEIE